MRPTRLVLSVLALLALTIPAFAGGPVATTHDPNTLDLTGVHWTPASPKTHFQPPQLKGAGGTILPGGYPIGFVDSQELVAFGCYGAFATCQIWVSKDDGVFVRLPEVLDVGGSYSNGGREFWWAKPLEAAPTSYVQSKVRKLVGESDYRFLVQVWGDNPVNPITYAYYWTTRKGGGKG